MGVSPKTANKYVRDSRWRLGKGPWTDGQIARAKVWREKHYPVDGEVAEPEAAPVAAAAAVSPVVGDLDGVGGDALADGADTGMEGLSVERREKLRLVIERRVTMQTDRELLLGNYVKKEDVDRERLARVAAVKTELTNVRLLALKMEGKPLTQRETILEDWARDVCNKFAGR